MESWRLVWRDGFAKHMSDSALSALAKGLEADDPAILQGATTAPPPLMCVQDWPVEGADPIGYGGWKGDGLETVGEVEEYFAKMCFNADTSLGESAACRWFLNWWDDTDRQTVRVQMMAEVDIEIQRRKANG